MGIFFNTLYSLSSLLLQCLLHKLVEMLVFRHYTVFKLPAPSIDDEIMKTTAASKHFGRIFQQKSNLVVAIKKAKLPSSNFLFLYDAGRARYFVEPFFLFTLDLVNLAIQPEYRHYLVLKGVSLVCQDNLGWGETEKNVCKNVYMYNYVYLCARKYKQHIPTECACC